MAIYHAKNAVVYIGSAGGATAEELLGCSEWTLDMATDTVEVTSFGDVNKTYVQGLPDVKGSFTAFWRDDEDKLFGAAAATSPVYCYLYFSRNAPTLYAYGTAWFSVSMSAGVAGAVTCNASFTAGGPWTIKSS